MIAAVCLRAKEEEEEEEEKEEEEKEEEEEEEERETSLKSLAVTSADRWSAVSFFKPSRARVLSPLSPL
jgi:protein involved in sex pheromone biosynthesis